VDNPGENLDAQKRQARDIQTGMFIYLAGEYREVLATGVPIFADALDSRIFQIKGIEGSIHLPGDRLMWTIA
jgi:hypothetical protein